MEYLVLPTRLLLIWNNYLVLNSACWEERGGTRGRARAHNPGFVESRDEEQLQLSAYRL